MSLHDRIEGMNITELNKTIAEVTALGDAARNEHRHNQADFYFQVVSDLKDRRGWLRNFNEQQRQLRLK